MLIHLCLVPILAPICQKAVEQTLAKGATEYDCRCHAGDDACLGGPVTGKQRGRGTEKAKIFVALSLDVSGNPRYLTMHVTANIKQASTHLTLLSGK